MSSLEEEWWSFADKPPRIEVAAAVHHANSAVAMRIAKKRRMVAEELDPHSSAAVMQLRAARNRQEDLEIFQNNRFEIALYFNRGHSIDVVAKEFNVSRKMLRRKRDELVECGMRHTIKL